MFTVRRLLALLLCLATTQAAGEPERHRLHVMLQGDSATAMARLVESTGGTLTHQLPVIRAVGARLTRDQLEQILASDQVQRYIDDLALEDQPGQETPAEAPLPECDVAGAVEIKRIAGGLAWPVFNKLNKPAQLERVELDWPQALGRLTSLSLGGKPLGVGDTPGNSPLTISAGRDAIVASGDVAELALGFEHPMPTTLAQRDIGLTAHFRGGCETRLIPGYDDNLTDYYFAEVTGADQLHLEGVRGSGVTVAVLDSGLWEHADLALDTAGKTRVPVRYDAIAGKEVDEAFDESGHGTHLASAIANSSPTVRQGAKVGGYRGIAPDARIIPIKAFNEAGQGSMLDIVRGIQWAVDNRERYDIRILNLSFSARPRWPYFLDPINQAVMQAWASGIVVIAAAGNEGPEPMSVGSPGNTPYIITVGAITDSWTPLDRSDDYIPDFSSRGPTPEAHIKPDLVAPGGHITGRIRPQSSLTLEHPEYALDADTFVLTGSSQAAAVVSGLVALLLQIEPQLSADDIKCKLLSGADLAINADGLLAYSPFDQGHGYVNIVRSILIGNVGCGNTDLDLAADIAMQEHFEGPAIVDGKGRITLPGLEHILSPVTPAKGSSDTRAWGVKNHVERLPPDFTSAPDAPFDWIGQYQEEGRRVRALTEQP
ncbi:alkaline serine protease [Mangrovimicrobium sediminis]|uniref:Alkaline serine protease n=1 Tax=Mangrovimicrobium sediminis TaxID=2562682 RepID=A0A4Z0M3U1_9GAMM|nr:S8 family peptidase [Haliea sp. SAOS-164]TGD74124.1 alkaline serine protease [Haliea sp. SAOS-164]